MFQSTLVEEFLLDGLPDQVFSSPSSLGSQDVKISSAVRADICGLVMFHETGLDRRKMERIHGCSPVESISESLSLSLAYAQIIQCM